VLGISGFNARWWWWSASVAVLCLLYCWHCRVWFQHEFCSKHISRSMLMHRLISPWRCQVFRDCRRCRLPATLHLFCRVVRSQMPSSSTDRCMVARAPNHRHCRLSTVSSLMMIAVVRSQWKSVVSFTMLAVISRLLTEVNNLTPIVAIWVQL